MKAFPGMTKQRSRMHLTEGIDLRDYFAAQVICNSYLANLSAAELADQAYDIADAMMARRSRNLTNELSPLQR